ncbi:MAG: hypothetical protein PHY09_17250 [Desulfuromonadaceae bacterium]|nr:hypothetical protein [Desulfuromonadaceae bacterium]MDD5106711.1 hypothetical protein [Desulfuromonadaceae bacterium]
MQSLNLELSIVDEDIRSYFLEDEEGKYIPKLPIQIQLVRLLRQLLHEGDNSQNCSNNCEHSENDVQPKELVRKPGCCSFMFVDGFNKVIGKDCEQCALNFLMELGARLSVVTESLNDLRGRHADIVALLRGFRSD